MKVRILINQKPYNEWGCGHRLQYLIQYAEHKSNINLEDQQTYLDDKGFHRLNKIKNYSNILGINKKKKDYGIWKEVLYTPIKIKEIQVNQNIHKSS